MPASLIDKIKRTIFYYELNAKWHPDYSIDSKYNTPFQQLLSKITRLATNRDEDRYQSVGEKEIFINEQKFSSQQNKHIVEGKLLSVRKDFFPELLDTSTDNLRDIEARVDEGVVETTHFLIQERNNNRTDKVKVAIEHNQFGAKINDLKYYLETIGIKYNIVESIELIPLVTNDLDELKDRMGEVSKILIKVHKNNLPFLKQTNNNLFGSMDAIADHYQQDYITVGLKYDIRQNRRYPTNNASKGARELVNSLFSFLKRKPENAEMFEQLEIKAEDSEKNNNVMLFDLLANRVKDEFAVERRSPSKTLVSKDMFARMKHSWQNLGVRV